MVYGKGGREGGILLQILEEEEKGKEGGTDFEGRKSSLWRAPFKALDPFLSARRRREGEESLRFRMEGCCSFCDDREREEGEEVFLERVNL